MSQQYRQTKEEKGEKKNLNKLTTASNGGKVICEHFNMNLEGFI